MRVASTTAQPVMLAKSRAASRIAGVAMSAAETMTSTWHVYRFTSRPVARPGAIGAPTSYESSRHAWRASRSEEHTSELQSQFHLVCRLLLEKKNDLIVRCLQAIIARLRYRLR